MVYVGTREYKYKGMAMSHMAADTIEELHLMAKNIGIDIKYFQNKPGKPHYDICKQNKALAMKLGAKLVDDREIILMFKKQNEKI
jgi:hypothetical protein